MTALFSNFSSDELYAYLKHCRPDLCIIEGGEEAGEEDGDEEEFVLIEDREGEEDEDEEVFQKQCRSGEDWEVSSVNLVKLFNSSQQLLAYLLNVRKTL